MGSEAAPRPPCARGGCVGAASVPVPTGQRWPGSRRHQGPLRATRMGAGTPASPAAPPRDSRRRRRRARAAAAQGLGFRGRRPSCGRGGFLLWGAPCSRSAPTHPRGPGPTAPGPPPPGPGASAPANVPKLSDSSPSPGRGASDNAGASPGGQHVRGRGAPGQGLQAEVPVLGTRATQAMSGGRLGCRFPAPLPPQTTAAEAGQDSQFSSS